MHPDHQPYVRFTSKSRFDKMINSLLGMVEGIAIDGVVNKTEINRLHNWLTEYAELQGMHPMNELYPIVKTALSDGVLCQEEKEDITWLCNRLQSEEYYVSTTAGIQRLHGIVGGIITDGVITEDEVSGLSKWMDDHAYLSRCWPYDEINSLATAFMRDRQIDEPEHAILLGLFSEFVNSQSHKAVDSPAVSICQSITGLCAACPEIEFEGRTFCFTGASARYVRSQLVEIVTSLNGHFSPTVNESVDYLIIGSDGNPCWAYACYGRKVEKAVALRKSGFPLLLVHENDFHDAVQDAK